MCDSSQAFVLMQSHYNHTCTYNKHGVNMHALPQSTPDAQCKCRQISVSILNSSLVLTINWEDLVVKQACEQSGSVP